MRPVFSYPAWKRVLDVAISAPMLVILLPIYPVIALAIKINSRGPALIKLKRISEGRSIYVYKFRSMIDGADRLKPGLAAENERDDGPFFKIKKDPRITTVGRFLRRLKIDEFPQLINVLLGDLALVGPRPHEPEEVAHYPDPYKHLILSRAGATGLSQVSGASSLPYLEELSLDDWYIKNCSMRLDLKIIGKTAKIIFSDPSGV